REDGGDRHEERDPRGAAVREPPRLDEPEAEQSETGRGDERDDELVDRGRRDDRGQVLRRRRDRREQRLERIRDEDEGLDGGEQDRAGEQGRDLAPDVGMTRDERGRKQDRREP